MDWGSLVTLLLLALVLAAQPWSVVAGILLVSSRRGVAKEVAYVAGWMVALTAVALITYALYPQVPRTSSTSNVLAWVSIAAGVALGGWVVARYRHPRAKAPTEPKWMGRLDDAPPALAFVLGAFLPNYVIVVAAVDQMLSSDLHSAGMVAALVGFVLVASIGVAAPLAVVVFRRDQAPQVYERWRRWLIANSSLAVLGVVGLVAVVLLVKGVVSLVT